MGQINKFWSEEEIVFLEERWGKTSIPYMAKTMGRSIYSVKSKAYKLGLGRFSQSGTYISLNILIKALGYKQSYTDMLIKFQRNGCPIINKTIIKSKMRVIDIEQFWKWAEGNKEILNFSWFEENELGLEPAWVKEKRKQDKSSPNKFNRNRLWTEEDDRLLIAKTKSNRYTYSQLAADFRRTEPAIKKRLRTLNVPYRPIPRDNHIRWTITENDLLLKYYEAGLTPNEIAKKINKSEHSIRERVKILKEKPAKAVNRVWTKEEIEYLKKYFSVKSNGELAVELDRTINSITKKAARIGITSKYGIAREPQNRSKNVSTRGEN